MSESLQLHADALQKHFGDKIQNLILEYAEITIDIAPAALIEVSTALRDTADFAYQQLIDLCGVDYSQLGQSEWQTDKASHSGFSRAVEPGTMGHLTFGDELEAVATGMPRFASVMHLISYTHNRRLRIRVFAETMTFR